MNKKGFSLIELIMAVSIIAIVAGVGTVLRGALSSKEIEDVHSQ